MDEQLLAGARQALERLRHAERETEAARCGFVLALRRVMDGAQPPDVAAALGLSDQEFRRLLQAGSTGRKRRRARTPLLACTFCGRSQREVRKLIVGPGVYICDACVELAEGVASTGTAAGTQLGAIHAVPEQDRQARCTFCGKNRDHVTGLAPLAAETGGQASGPAICTECLSLCNEILAEELGMTQ